MDTNNKLNLTMLCDFYELTMANGYFENGYRDRITYFDLFFRRCPTAAASASLPVWSRSSATSRSSISLRRTSRICAAATSLPSPSWST